MLKVQGPAWSGRTSRATMKLKSELSRDEACGGRCSPRRRSSEQRYVRASAAAAANGAQGLGSPGQSEPRRVISRTRDQRRAVHVLALCRARGRHVIVTSPGRASTSARLCDCERRRRYVTAGRPSTTPRRHLCCVHPACIDI